LDTPSYISPPDGMLYPPPELTGSVLCSKCRRNKQNGVVKAMYSPPGQGALSEHHSEGLCLHVQIDPSAREWGTFRRWGQGGSTHTFINLPSQCVLHRENEEPPKDTATGSNLGPKTYYPEVFTRYSSFPIHHSESFTHSMLCDIN